MYIYIQIYLNIERLYSWWMERLRCMEEEWTNAKTLRDKDQVSLGCIISGFCCEYRKLWQCMISMIALKILVWGRHIMIMTNLLAFWFGMPNCCFYSVHDLEPAHAKLGNWKRLSLIYVSVCACACAIVRCPSVCSPTWFTCTINTILETSRGAYRSACTATISQHTIPCKKCNVKQHIHHLPHIAFTA